MHKGGAVNYTTDGCPSHHLAVFEHTLPSIINPIKCSHHSRRRLQSRASWVWGCQATATSSSGVRPAICRQLNSVHEHRFRGHPATPAGTVERWRGPNVQHAPPSQNSQYSNPVCSRDGPGSESSSECQTSLNYIMNLASLFESRFS